MSFFPEDRLERIFKELSEAKVALTDDSDLVDAGYVTKILANVDDLTQKFEGYIQEVSYAGNELESATTDKRDYYEALLHDSITSDTEKRGTGTERLNAAKYKHKNVLAEIREMEKECKRLKNAEEMLKRRISSLSATRSSVKSSWEAVVRSMQNQFLGDRESRDLLVPEQTPTDDDVTALLKGERKEDSSNLLDDL